jgi:hypothetical protein
MEYYFEHIIFSLKYNVVKFLYYYFERLNDFKKILKLYSYESL